jgi:predicted RNA binding protein YcfA (HicA-like mRNA interferase family)
VSRREKLLAKIRANPRGVRFGELAKLLEWHGFELKRVKGSHHYFAQGPYLVCVVRRRPHVHIQAVKEVLSILDELLEDA